MPTRQFQFRNRLGLRLSGTIEMPEGRALGWALLAHCFTCGKNSLPTVRMARTLATLGIGALRFDFAGLGESEGAFSETTFSSNVEDILCAAEAMSESGIPPGLLVGHSLGGAAVIAAAARMTGARAVAAIAAPFEVAHVFHHVDRSDLQRMEAGEGQVARIAGRALAVGRSFVQDALAHDQRARVASLNCPLLLLHSPHDKVVDIHHARSIYMAARHPKSYVSLGDADHFLSGPGEPEHVARLICAWAGRYVAHGASPN